MNRLEPPDFINDDAVIDDLSLNNLLKSYPALQQHVPAIKAGYAQYIAANGDALAIQKVALPKVIEGYLTDLYASAPNDLAFIGEIREASDPECCPMCGSFHSGTLDHVMPKAQYASFAIFGHNLVPACRCNTKRTSLTVGPNPGERVLHPYFDDILQTRLIAARFDELGPVPRVTLGVLVDPNNPLFPAVRFHIDNVIHRTTILDATRKEWNKMLRRPSITASALRHDPPTRAALKDVLALELNRQDDTHGGKNNWQSFFISGLLEDHVLDWMFVAFGRPGRGADAPLLDGIT